MLLPYIDRRPLTYLVSPSTGVNSKKIDPWSFFLIFGPPCSEGVVVADADSDMGHGEVTWEPLS